MIAHEPILNDRTKTGISRLCHITSLVLIGCAIALQFTSLLYASKSARERADSVHRHESVRDRSADTAKLFASSSDSFGRSAIGFLVSAILTGILSYRRREPVRHDVFVGLVVVFVLLFVVII